MRSLGGWSVRPVRRNHCCPLRRYTHARAHQIPPFNRNAPVRYVSLGLAGKLPPPPRQTDERSHSLARRIHHLAAAALVPPSSPRPLPPPPPLQPSSLLLLGLSLLLRLSRSCQLFIFRLHPGLPFDSRWWDQEVERLQQRDFITRARSAMDEVGRAWHGLDPFAHLIGRVAVIDHPCQKHNW